ncbi:hypothetical protein HMI48_10300 [Acidithiobacillus ferrooxidans]|uniref:hypothetical protein n=1 Tax=Acidithiobacillus ferrooxidans TaxID=920 RepID=UPI001C07CB12|nr:hypothetical protein [Acidithiobacillus ferrooxidans]MBU2774253.1 hypothetical protein [Acidithiobacillus ferrooxidans]
MEPNKEKCDRISRGKVSCGAQKGKTMIQSWMMTIIFSTFILVFYVGVYGFVLRRLAHEAQPIRLKLAEFGEVMLTQETFNPVQRQYITWCLDHAFSPWPMIVATFFMPFLAIKLIVFGVGKPSFYDDSRLTRLTGLFLLSTFVANPIFGLMYGLELLVLGIILLLRGGVPMVLRMAASSVIVESKSWSRTVRQHV